MVERPDSDFVRMLQTMAQYGAHVLKMNVFNNDARWAKLTHNVRLLMNACARKRNCDGGREELECVPTNGIVQRAAASSPIWPLLSRTQPLTCCSPIPCRFLVHR